MCYSAKTQTFSPTKHTPNSPVWIHVLFSNTPQITLESQTCVLFGTNTSKTLAPPRGDYCVTSVGPH